MALFHRFRGLSSRKTPFITGILVAVGLLAAGTFGMYRVGAASCSDNNILQCGFSSKTNFIDQVQANSDGHGHTDLQAIYSHYHLSSADYANFAAHAVPGTAKRNGDIVVNGQTVGTSSRSVGRQKFESSDTAVPIGGTTYYENTLDQRFADGVQELDVYVLFNTNGTPKFVVMPSCGNPVIPTPVPTSAACKTLTPAKVDGKANTYTFTAAATSTPNVHIDKFVYDFGDGSPTVTETSGTTPTPAHTFTKTSTVTVTVFATFPGGTSHALPAVSLCAKQLTVVKPTPPPVVAVACVNLVPATVDETKMSFTFIATSQVTPAGGATLTSGDFDFGDGNKASGVKPNSDGVTVTASHTYASANNFTASAVLHFTDSHGKGITAAACTVPISPTTPPTPPPIVPPVVPAVAASVPVELPNTGAGDTIALFSAVTIAGFVGYRQLLVRRQRNNS